MKKLTIEEKAARYDEILAKAKRYYNEYKTRDNILYVEDMEDMFSELKESENNDEKIRKMLIAFVKNDCIIASDKNKQDALTWLKKQNTDISSFSNEQQTYMEKYISLDKITLIKLLAERDANNAEIIESFEKQDEQKSDTIFLKFRIGDKVTNGEDTYTINFIGKDRYWVKEHDCATIPFEYQHNWKLVEQNPAWSEDDEKQLNDIIGLLPGLNIRHNWLKSFKYRVQPQQKQEWSKEDEQATNVMLHLLRDLLSENKYPFLSKRYVNAIKFIKSFKERYTWKPSDEQIEALNFVIKSLDNMFTATGYMDNYTKSRLEEILEALKKLKGE